MISSSFSKRFNQPSEGLLFSSAECRIYFSKSAREELILVFQKNTFAKYRRELGILEVGALPRGNLVWKLPCPPTLLKSRFSGPAVIYCHAVTLDWFHPALTTARMGDRNPAQRLHFSLIKASMGSPLPSLCSWSTVNIPSKLAARHRSSQAVCLVPSVLSLASSRPILCSSTLAACSLFSFPGLGPDPNLTPHKELAGSC